MKRRTRWILGAVAAGAIASGVVGGVAVAGSEESETPITGAALDKASAAALAYVGGGRVTGTEVGDEDSYYEVEVTKADGSQVDVQLDKTFAVVGSKADTPDDENGQ